MPNYSVSGDREGSRLQRDSSVIRRGGNMGTELCTVIYINIYIYVCVCVCVCVWTCLQLVI